MDKSNTSEIRDRELEKLWEQLEDVPMDPVTERMEAPFLDFPVGTHREEIWHWFDERHSKGVVYLLFDYNRPMIIDGDQESEIDFGEEDEWEEDDIPSAYGGDYGPSNPWDAPGMSISDFI